MAHACANQGRLSERESYCRPGEEAVALLPSQVCPRSVGGGTKKGQCLDVICGKKLDQRACISGY
jgi:hypothetical protein